MYTIEELRKDLARYNKEYTRSCEELESTAWADGDGQDAMETNQKWLVEQLLIVLPKMEVLERENASLKEKLAAVESIVWGARTLVAYPSNEVISDISDILGGKQ